MTGEIIDRRFAIEDRQTELDAVLSPAMAEGMPGIVGDLEMHMVKGSGHWTQQEKPAEVDRLILDWLQRRFPK